VAARHSERLRQLRGLLLIAAVVLGIILFKAAPLELFQPGWWRL
jgi:hypothetical protein